MRPRKHRVASPRLAHAQRPRRSAGKADISMIALYPASIRSINHSLTRLASLPFTRPPINHGPGLPRLKLSWSHPYRQDCLEGECSVPRIIGMHPIKTGIHSRRANVRQRATDRQWPMSPRARLSSMNGGGLRSPDASLRAHANPFMSIVRVSAAPSAIQRSK